MDIIDWTQMKLLNPKTMVYVFMFIGLGLMAHGTYRLIKDNK
jgi:hypothetical protein